MNEKKILSELKADFNKKNKGEYRLLYSPDKRVDCMLLRLGPPAEYGEVLAYHSCRHVKDNFDKSSGRIPEAVKNEFQKFKELLVNFIQTKRIN